MKMNFAKSPVTGILGNLPVHCVVWPHQSQHCDLGSNYPQDLVSCNLMCTFLLFDAVVNEPADHKSFHSFSEYKITVIPHYVMMFSEMSK
jgi:hypothetical protein